MLSQIKKTAFASFGAIFYTVFARQFSSDPIVYGFSQKYATQKPNTTTRVTVPCFARNDGAISTFKITTLGLTPNMLLRVRGIFLQSLNSAFVGKLKPPWCDPNDRGLFVWPFFTR